MSNAKIRYRRRRRARLRAEKESWVSEMTALLARYSAHTDAMLTRVYNLNSALLGRGMDASSPTAPDHQVYRVVRSSGL